MANSKLTKHEHTLLVTLQSMLQGSQWCLYLSAKQNIEKFGGMLPSLVLRNIPGEQVLSIPLGQEEIVTLGNDEDSAFRRIDVMNETLGLNYETVMSICHSAGLKVYDPETDWQQSSLSAAYS